MKNLSNQGPDMPKVLIRDVVDSDYNRVIDLNACEIQYTSAMDIDRARHLDSLSDYHRVAEVNGHVAAFILAMKDHVPYVNDNYSWFSGRYERFLYIDRIVVDRPYQGLKIGTLLYRDIVHYARKENIPVITCEIMIEPPNKRSLAFHARQGFKEVGIRSVENDSVKYSMQAMPVTAV